MEASEKIFKWYDSARPNDPFEGPYYWSWIDEIGKSLTHTGEELLKLPISATLKKRIKEAREGTKIKMHYLHSCGDVCVRRLKQDEIDYDNKVKDLETELKEVNAEIKKLTPKHLSDRKKDIEKQLRKLKKKSVRG